MSDALVPPTEPIVDPGAHELTDASDDHFSDASEGRHSDSAGRLTPQSPIPVTRVERVDDEPRHGEVPGTPAYKMRTQDAVPDEIEIVPDGQRSRSTSKVSESDRPMSPAGMPIPKTIVEKVDPNSPSHGEVPGTTAYEKRSADAEPDEVLKSPIEAISPLKGEPTEHPSFRSISSVRDRPSLDQSTTDSSIPPVGLDLANEQTSATTEQEMVSAVSQVTISQLNRDAMTDNTTIETHVTPEPGPEFGSKPEPETEPETEKVEPEQALRPAQEGESATNPIPEPEVELEDNFDDDDFDDFGEEVAPGDAHDDDFDDFGAAEHQPETIQLVLPPDLLAHLPALELFNKTAQEERYAAISPYLQTIFPDLDVSVLDRSSTQRAKPGPLLSDRSASLWAQLIAPPPLQPPDWTRSRIRRLFLVSLGVPVDLDEILPASKQKKLVLPSAASSSASQANRTTQLKKDADKDGRPDSSTERSGPPPPPDFDAQETRQLCSTTEAALSGYTDEELQQHVNKLERLSEIAEELLAYWTKRKDSAVGDKEAFEGVIKNLVGFMKKSKSKR